MAYYLFLLGKFLLGGAFVVFGVRNIRNVEKLTAAQANKQLPIPARTAMQIGVGMQIVGGALVAVTAGWLAALGALVLIAFVYIAAYLFHAFWTFAGDAQIPHVNAWIMNTALAGAFVMVIAASI